jgi:hypothetical protein
MRSSAANLFTSGLNNCASVVVLAGLGLFITVRSGLRAGSGRRRTVYFCVVLVCRVVMAGWNITLARRARRVFMFARGTSRN